MKDWHCNICEMVLYSSRSAWTHYNKEHVQFKYICTICADEFRSKASFDFHWVDARHQRKSQNDDKYFLRRIELNDAMNGGLGKLFTWKEHKYERKPHSPENSRAYRHRHACDSAPKNGHDSVKTDRHPSSVPVYGKAGPSNQKYKLKYSDDERYDSLKMTFVKLGDTAKGASASPHREAPESGRLAGYKEFMEHHKLFKNDNYDCPVCESPLANRQSLIHHLTALHGMRDLPACLQPQSGFFARRLITWFKAKQCIVCKRNYSSREELKSHLAKRHEISVHPCSHPSCTHAYLHRTSLQKHEKDSHGLNSSGGTSTSNSSDRL